MKDQLRRAVQRGAELLDGAVPGWAERVDTDGLDMRDMAVCVLGQLGDGWAESGLCIVFGLDSRGWRPRGLADDGWDDHYNLIDIPMDRSLLGAWTIAHGFDLDRELAGKE